MIRGNGIDIAAPDGRPLDRAHIRFAFHEFGARHVMIPRARLSFGKVLFRKGYHGSRDPAPCSGESDSVPDRHPLYRVFLHDMSLQGLTDSI